MTLSHVTVTKAASFNTGAGDDSIAVDDSDFGGAVAITTAAGADHLAIEQGGAGDGPSTVFHKALTVTLGNDNDLVDIGQAASPGRLGVFEAKVTLDGGAGSNTLNANSTETAIQPVIRNMVVNASPPAAPGFDLSVASDAGAVGDGQTTAGRVTLVGHTDPTTPVRLVQTGQTTTSDETGAFQFPDVNLPVGPITFTVTATDLGGRTSQAQRTLTGVASAAAGDVVLDWNQTLLNAVRQDDSAPPLASRNMAMVQIAVYDAVNAIQGTHGLYVDAAAPAGASLDAAVAGAAHRVLSFLYPDQAATFDAQLAATLAGVPAGAAQTDGLAVGRQVADAIIAWRRNDGADQFVNYVPGTGPGVWQPALPAFAPAVLPQWPQVTPFVMTSGSEFRPAGPPALGSDQYASDFNQTKDSWP